MEVSVPPLTTSRSFELRCFHAIDTLVLKSIARKTCKTASGNTSSLLPLPSIPILSLRSHLRHTSSSPLGHVHSLSTISRLSSQTCRLHHRSHTTQSSPTHKPSRSTSTPHSIFYELRCGLHIPSQILVEGAQFFSVRAYWREIEKMREGIFDHPRAFPTNRVMDQWIIVMINMIKAEY